MPISREFFSPAERASCAFRCLSELASSCDWVCVCDLEWDWERERVCGVWREGLSSEPSGIVVRGPRVARCSFNRSWRRDEDGVTSEVLLLASGVLDLHVWMVRGDELMGDGSFSHDISVLVREGISIVRVPFTRARAAGWGGRSNFVFVLGLCLKGRPDWDGGVVPGEVEFKQWRKEDGVADWTATECRLSDL